MVPDGLGEFDDLAHQFLPLRHVRHPSESQLGHWLLAANALAANVLAMPRYSTPEGREFDLDEDTLKDLLALSDITRKPANELARQAIEQLRNTLVPSTREAPARAARKAKGATA